MNIAHIEEQSFIYGPGCRFVIWIQGCSIHCKGCWNKEMWSFKTKDKFSMEELLKKILKEKEFIQGITILGGEPFDQYKEVLELIREIKRVNLSVILYTGYSEKELVVKNNTEVFKLIDVLISGRYEQEQRTEKGGLIGSSNQEINFLTTRYSKEDLPLQNEIEISISENGHIDMYGYPFE